MQGQLEARLKELTASEAALKGEAARLRGGLAAAEAASAERAGRVAALEDDVGRLTRQAEADRKAAEQLLASELARAQREAVAAAQRREATAAAELASAREAAAQQGDAARSAAEAALRQQMEELKRAAEAEAQAAAERHKQVRARCTRIGRPAGGGLYPLKVGNGSCNVFNTI